MIEYEVEDINLPIIMKKVLLWIWQFPQNIVGWILYHWSYKTIFTLNGIEFRYASFTNGSAVSLGNYIYLDVKYAGISESRQLFTVNHEHGHQIQSLYLGPLYLLVVGLPSLCLNIYSRIKHKDNKWYYSKFPENWANKLGGVSYK